MVYWKRKATAAKRFVKKRVIRPYTSLKNNRGYNNRMRLYKEVSALKKMINAEKKNADSSVTTVYDLAQLNGAGVSGAQTLDLMPSIGQGNSEDQRNGDSIKVCAWALKLHVESNSFNTLQDTHYKFYVIASPTNPVGAGTTLLSQFLEANPFSTVEDYYSSLNYQHRKDFNILGVVTGVLKQNSNGSTNQIRSNSHIIARKANFHVRYNKGTTTILNNRLTLIAVASDGDRTGTNKINFQYHMKVYFYDN